jgi:hypothetical protein
MGGLAIKIPSRVSSVLSRRAFHLTAQLIASLVYLYWCFHLPAPGKAVLALSVVAVVLTLAEMEPRHKAVWLILILVLVHLENRAIDKDRADSERRQGEAVNAEQEQFGKILAQNQQDFSSTMGRMESVLARTERAVELSQENLKNITGGNSFAVLYPQGHAVAASGELPMTIKNKGDYALTGVTVSMWRPPNSSPYGMSPIYLGTLAPGEIHMTGIWLKPQPDEKSGIDGYWIRISAQNFTVDEVLQIRKGHPGSLPWEYRLWISRMVPGRDKKGKTIPGYSVMKFLKKPSPWNSD